MNAECQDQLVRRLVAKVRKNVDKIALYDEHEVEGADVVVISYGITSRIATRAVRQAREKGVKAGHLRLVVVWPFIEEYVRALAKRVKAIVVPELNLGQVVLEVERCAAGQCKVVSVPHAGGAVHLPGTILDAIMEAGR